MKASFAVSLISLLTIACTSPRQAQLTSINAIRYIGHYSLPHKLNYKGTTVGGLSGIDYSPKENVYYVISDDRSDINPMRFYKIKIPKKTQGLDTVQFQSVHYFHEKSGRPFPSRKERPTAVPDPEGIRLHPGNRFLAWCSEGERIVRKGDTVLTNPALFLCDRKGRWIDSLPIPDNFKMQVKARGPRNNGVFEGISFSPDGKKLFVSLEEPLYDDGPRAGLFDTAGWVRILQYDVTTKAPEAQYAYQIDPVVKEPISQGLFVVNGITDILAINNHQLLITERSFSTGRLGNSVRLFLVDLRGANDVSSTPSLHHATAIKPLAKKLLLNMDALGILVDNIEGGTFGPRLPNGKQSLIFIADDNFSPQQKTQFLLFEVD